jgi:hypothetical protein
VTHAESRRPSSTPRRDPLVAHRQHHQADFRKGSINVEPFCPKSATKREPKVTLPPTMIHFQRDENYGLRAYDGDASTLSSTT